MHWRSFPGEKPFAALCIALVVAAVIVRVTAAIEPQPYETPPLPPAIYYGTAASGTRVALWHVKAADPTTGIKWCGTSKADAGGIWAVTVDHTSDCQPEPGDLLRFMVAGLWQDQTVVYEPGGTVPWYARNATGLLLTRGHPWNAQSFFAHDRLALLQIETALQEGETMPPELQAWFDGILGR